MSVADEFTDDDSLDGTPIFYDRFGHDDATILDLNSDITDMIDEGKYDKAEEVVTKRLENEPLCSVFHQLFFRIQTLRQLTPSFPADSEATKRLKQRFLSLIKKHKPELTHIQHLNYTEMLFNKYFYFVEYSDETILNSIIAEIPDFNLFKNN